MMPERTLHLTLPQDLHEDLEREARRTGSSVAALAREAIATSLRARKRERIAEDLRAFAAAHAGTEWDLDEAVERAAADHLLVPPATPERPS